MGVSPASPQFARIRVAQVIDEAGDEPLGAAPDAESPMAEPETDASITGGTGERVHGEADQLAEAQAEAQAAIEDARRRVSEVPAEVVVTNHVMGLYELAAIHLSADEPDLRSAALAIDAVACLVDGLGDRLGAEAKTMRDALGNIRLAFVEIKGRVASAAE